MSRTWKMIGAGLFVVTIGVFAQMAGSSQQVSAWQGPSVRNATEGNNWRLTVDGARPPAGLYRVTVYVSGVGNGSVALQLNYTDYDGPATQASQLVFNNGGLERPYGWPNRYSIVWSFLTDGSNNVVLAAVPNGGVVYSATVTLEKL